MENIGRAARVLALFWLVGTTAAQAQNAADFDGDGRANALDNCRYTSNPTQRDSSIPTDGIGDACTCGDMGADGLVDLSDVVLLRRYLAGLGPGVSDLAKCSVTGGSSDCDAGDAALLRTALVNPGLQIAMPCRAFVGASGVPTGMAVAGDSITRGFAADCECNLGFSCLLDCLLGGTEQPEHSWFDGDASSVFSLVDRFRTFSSSI